MTSSRVHPGFHPRPRHFQRFAGYVLILPRHFHLPRGCLRIQVRLPHFHAPAFPRPEC